MIAERQEAVIADLLRSIRVRSSVFARPELRAPWGFEVVDEGAAFHIVTGGRCCITTDAVPEPIALDTGDFVVLPRGGVHALRDAPGSPVIRLDRSLKTRRRGRDGVFRAGGEGAITTLACGNLRFEDVSADLLLAVLPDVMHVRAKANRFAPWIDATMAQIRSDLEAGRPAAEIVVARLADILFIQAVEAYFEENAETAESGWFAALHDRYVGEALALLHLQPDRPWTVASLAREVGLSRSALAARFGALVGEPPLRYLTRVRLNAVAARLRSTDEKVSAIALSFGYDSVSGLNKGFKARFGETPREYRRRFSRKAGV